MLSSRVAEKRVEEGKEAKVDSASLAVLVARVGATDQKIVTSTIEEGRYCKMFHREQIFKFLSLGW